MKKAQLKIEFEDGSSETIQELETEIKYLESKTTTLTKFFQEFVEDTKNPIEEEVYKFWHSAAIRLQYSTLQMSKSLLKVLIERELNKAHDTI